MEEQGAVTVMGAPDGASKAFRALIVFARLPVPGKVKSRLARGVGMGAACEFYKACAEKIIAEAARCPDVVRYLFFADVEDAPEIARWMHAIGQAASLQIRAQAEGDVGARMRAAFGSVFADGASQAVVVGTDIPDLSAAVLMSSFHALDHHDVVFGPAQDGGYYLLGLTRPLPALFEGIAWSTSDVLARSRQAACDAGLSVAPSESLPTLLDVDTADDLEHWGTVRSRKRTTVADIVEYLSANHRSGQ